LKIGPILTMVVSDLALSFSFLLFKRRSLGKKIWREALKKWSNL